jgi:hypothetical protein
MENNVTLLQKINEFCEAKAMTWTRFGLAACGNPHFVFRLQAGKTVTLRTWERAEAFMRDNADMRPLILPVMPRAPYIHPSKGRRKAKPAEHAPSSPPISPPAPAAAASAPSVQPATLAERIRAVFAT